MKTLTQSGAMVEGSVYDDFDEATDYAQRSGIRYLHVVEDEIEIIDLDTL